MRDKFIAEDFELDLSECKISITEENPRFKDSLWVKYSLPVETNMDRAFYSKAGHYSSILAKGLKRFHEGTHIFEGRALKGKLEVLKITGNILRFQIESGFEELPNFDKKLEELPLINIEVPDIYLHAEDICKKKYPETNYNFPKLITEDYDLDSEQWKTFDGFINNRYRKDGVWGFPKNEVIDGSDVANRNIIHPVPYLLYLLQAGFLDAGFVLYGDILEDETLKQRTVYSAKQYFNTADQKEFKAYVFDTDYTPYTSGLQTTYSKKIQITAPGKYRVLGTFDMQNGDKLSILRNDDVLKYFSNTSTVVMSAQNNNTVEFSVSIGEAEMGVNIYFEFTGTAKNNTFDDLGKNIGVAQIQINPIRVHTTSGNPIPFVFNENRVDLRRSVPDMTFGEVVNTIKNWRNYDVIFDGSKVFMNLIKIDPATEPEDFQEHEVEVPERNFTDKQSFIIKFPETDLGIFDNILFDENGFKLNGKTNKNTSEININGFAAPVSILRGTTTAKIKNDQSGLILVHYSGLDENGQNHAKNPPGLHGSVLAEHLKPWFINRVTNLGFNWMFQALKNKIRNINIRSEIYCYGQRHWIKTLTKNQITPDIYSVEITTECIN